MIIIKCDKCGRELPYDTTEGVMIIFEQFMTVNSNGIIAIPQMAECSLCDDHKDNSAPKMKFFDLKRNGMEVQEGSFTGEFKNVNNITFN